MKLFCPCSRKKTQAQNLSNFENQSYYAVPYQNTNGRNDTQTDVHQQVEQLRRETEKLTKIINGLESQIEIDKLTEGKNRLKVQKNQGKDAYGSRICIKRPLIIKLAVCIREASRLWTALDL